MTLSQVRGDACVAGRHHRKGQAVGAIPAPAGARRLDELRAAAEGTGNLMVPIREALRDRCSLGEVCGAMHDVFGRYQPQL